MRLGVLGPFTVFEPGVAAPTPRRRALLSLLLVEEAPVPAAEISRVLWGDHRSLATLHVLVHRLRRWSSGMGLGELDLTPHGYRLHLPAGAVDTSRFRQLVAAGARTGGIAERVDTLDAALALWRGPVAADAPEPVRERPGAHRLRRLRHDAVCQLADAAMTAGQPDRALPYVVELAHDCPFTERLQALRAFLLAACGRQAEALWLVERTRRQLDRELGVSPGPHLRTAQLRILRQELRPDHIRDLVGARMRCAPA